jgi:hypothetical protein
MHAMHAMHGIPSTLLNRYKTFYDLVPLGTRAFKTHSTLVMHAFLALRLKRLEAPSQCRVVDRWTMSNRNAPV